MSLTVTLEEGDSAVVIRGSDMRAMVVAPDQSKEAGTDAFYVALALATASVDYDMMRQITGLLDNSIGIPKDKQKTKTYDEFSYMVENLSSATLN